MKEIYPLPKILLNAYEKCFKNIIANKKITNFPKKQFRLASADHSEEIANWFSMVSEETGLDITPSFIYNVVISKGLIEYKPARCPVCGKLFTTKQAKYGAKNCSEACRDKNPMTQERARQTYRKKYGVDAPSQCKEIREKMKASLQKHYGVNSPFESKAIRDKAKQSLTNHFGVDCSFKSKEVRDKAKATNLQKYGAECIFSNKDIRKKIEQTNLQKYGVITPLQNKSVQEKVKKTMLDKYGAELPFASKAIRDKAKATIINRYGVDYAMKSKEVFEKAKATCRLHYNADRPAQNKEILEKIKKTVKERYGAEYLVQSEEIQQRIKTANLKKYGVEYPMQSKEIQEKVKKTMLDRYGIEKPAQNAEMLLRTLQTKREIFWPELLQRFEKNNIEILSSKEQYINDGSAKLRCKLCNHEWTAIGIRQLLHCDNCHAAHCTSIAEKELVFFIKSLYKGEVKTNIRSLISPKEIDIYLPDLKLAFEFNGTYWHSENAGKPSDYHITKTRLCNKQGIRLVHIFEYEWVFNQEKIKSLIKSALGLFDHKLYARKCQVKPIDAKEYRDFLLLNHLQSAVGSPIRYGLYHQDELVSVIGFGQSRYKKGETELHRYCVKAGYQIIGGFSKLIKHACKDANITEFYSYIDLAHFSGRGYKKIGFEKVSVTSPSYIYIRGEEIKSRLQCQKHKLHAFLDYFDPQLSETENMLINDYDKVYDCGNLKVVYKV